MFLGLASALQPRSYLRRRAAGQRRRLHRTGQLRFQSRLPNSQLWVLPHYWRCLERPLLRWDRRGSSIGRESFAEPAHCYRRSTQIHPEALVPAEPRKRSCNKPRPHLTADICPGSIPSPCSSKDPIHAPPITCVVDSPLLLIVVPSERDQ